MAYGRRSIACAACLAALFVAACGHTHRAVHARPLPPGARLTLAVGDKAVGAGGVAAELYQVAEPAPTTLVSSFFPTAPPDTPLAAVDMEVCLEQGGLPQLDTDPRNVTVTSAKGELQRVAAPAGADMGSSPAFVVRQLAAGQCERGWLLFTVTNNAKPTSVRFRLPNGSQFTWDVKT